VQPHSNQVVGGSSVHHQASAKHTSGIGSRQSSGHNPASNHLTAASGTQPHPQSGIQRSV